MRLLRGLLRRLPFLGFIFSIAFHLFYIVFFVLQYLAFVALFLALCVCGRLAPLWGRFFSAAPQWCTWASNACATKCVFASLLLPSILPCTSSQVFAVWSLTKIAFLVPPLFSRAAVFRLFVGGSLLRRAPYLFSWWFSGWPFSSDFHLAPALLGSAPFLDVFGMHTCI